MEKFYNVYMYYNCDEKKYIPEEIQEMYDQKQRETNRKKFYWPSRKS